MIIPQEILNNLSIDDIDDIWNNFVLIDGKEYMFSPEQTKEIVMELVARAYELGCMRDIEIEDANLRKINQMPDKKRVTNKKYSDKELEDIIKSKGLCRHKKNCLKERNNLSSKKREEIYKKYKNVCQICERKLISINLPNPDETEYGVKNIHHIDLDRSNNQIDNLLLVCSYCHFVIHRKC